MNLFNKNGISLIEVIISLSILSILTMPFINIMIINNNYISNSEKKFMSNQIAQKYMEEYKFNKEISEGNCKYEHIKDDKIIDVIVEESEESEYLKKITIIVKDKKTNEELSRLVNLKNILR